MSLPLAMYTCPVVSICLCLYSICAYSRWLGGVIHFVTCVCSLHMRSPSPVPIRASSYPIAFVRTRARSRCVLALVSWPCRHFVLVGACPRVLVPSQGAHGHQ